MEDQKQLWLWCGWVNQQVKGLFLSLYHLSVSNKYLLFFKRIYQMDFSIILGHIHWRNINSRKIWKSWKSLVPIIFLIEEMVYIDFLNFWLLITFLYSLSFLLTPMSLLLKQKTCPMPAQTPLGWVLFVCVHSIVLEKELREHTWTCLKRLHMP